MSESKSLSETPTWAVATVIAFMIGFGILFHHLLTLFGKWLYKTKRKSLLSALNKIKEELMLFGLLSLLMGHWTIVIAKICIKSSLFSTRFYPCFLENDFKHSKKVLGIVAHQELQNVSVGIAEHQIRSSEYCEQGYESLASYESLEQLHRLMFILGMTHVTYSFLAIAMALAKIYSWGPWENEAKSMTNEIFREYPHGSTDTSRMKKLYTLIHNNVSHSWSQHKILIWLLCFSRQFWSSITKADYIVLRYGFVTTHELPLDYDFLKYMLRSLDEEFSDIVGISIPLWIFVILCTFLNFHGTHIYFWMSFLPTIMILVIGTKLHYIVAKLAIEVRHIKPWTEHPTLRLRDELFWFRKPRILLRLIQFISFQNALEMTMFLWSSWEIDEAACFMTNRTRVHIKLLFGVISQIWCNFITFPLYVIITQMGSRFKTTVVSEEVRKSLQEWRSRVMVKRSMKDESSTNNSLRSERLGRPLVPRHDALDMMESIGSISRRMSSPR